MTLEDDTGDVFVPPLITFDFSSEHVDQMARSLRDLLDADEVRLLDPALRAEHQVVMDQIDALDWADPALVIDQALAILKTATMPGHAIDPNDDHADVAWCRMLVRLVDVPVAGSRAARQWFTHLFRLRAEDIVVSTMTESTAAYAVAAYEHLRGRHHEVERWSMTAGLQTDFDADVGRGAVAYVRAARLLEPVLRRGSTFRS